MRGRFGDITISARDVTIQVPLTAVGQDLRPGRYLAFAVADQGAGMPPEVLRHAVEPFFTTKKLGEGTGLGLPMVFGFATQSGGALTIESDPARGTVATILLPWVRSIAPSARPAKSGLRAPGLKGLRLLIVEDRPELSRIVAAVSRSAGMQVTVAETVAAAIDLLHPEAFDLLLCDIMLGSSGSGYQVLAHARGTRPPVPALMMTGFGGTNDTVPPDLGEATILHKPFNARQLLDALERLSAVTEEGSKAGAPPLASA
jgi:CheY-like chemotaxis protein